MFKSTIGNTQDAPELQRQSKHNQPGETQSVSGNAYGNQALLQMKRADQMPPITSLRPSQTLGLQRKCAFENENPKLERTLQPKLAIGSPTDTLEQEADQMAEQVMNNFNQPIGKQPLSLASAQTPTVRRKCSACEEEEKLQRNVSIGSNKANDGVPPIVHEVIRSPGQPLDAGTREFMQSRFGRDFSQVRIHTDDKASESAKRVNALAYTIDKHISFAKGQYSPNSASGQRLIAHELVHTIQQNKGPENQEGRFDQGLNNGITQYHSPMLARQIEVDEGAPSDAGLPGAVDDTMPAPEQESSASSGGGGGGKPEPSLPDCTAIMGGRGINYKGLGVIFNHTYVNFKENAKDYWLIEGGPLPGAATTSGAWAKKGDWEAVGNRKTTTWSAEDCPTKEKLLFDTQTIYHGKALSYNATGGPNSNSFAEHLCFKAGVPSDFHWGDKAYDYWQSRTRPS